MTEFDQLQIRKLDGGLLLIFRELMARGRANDVAQHLGLSPSAVSHALGRLRDVFGEVLFVRRSHGLEPTRKALELQPRVEELLALMGATVSSGAPFDPAQSRRRFRIVGAEEIASLVCERLLASFRAEAPMAHFTTRWAILERALRAVRRGEADVALGMFQHIPSGFVARPLYQDDYCVIARQGHPVVQGSVSAAAYREIGHLFVGNPDGALADETPIDRPEMDATYGALPSPEQVRTHGYVSQWETAMLVVSESDVLAECPRSLARRYAAKLGLQVLDPPYRPFRFTVQAVRRADGVDPGVDWLLAKLEEAVAATPVG
ncbi:MAG TPA: LysR substrate-binding domain-containing protein [Caulobacteraceae bacterium]|nr:LysR substrate-binding domain-containing protein [Caulobacteraceae bacterium]